MKKKKGGLNHDKDLAVMKKLADIREATILYRVKDIQKPELAKFKSSARMMKLKIDIKQSPRGKETIIRLEGGKKQLRDFDRIARGKSSYGDPSTVKHFDEKSYGAGEEGTDELKKKYKKDTPMESLEENAIPKIKQIVAKKQAMKIDGVMVDMFTASAISQIYDKVNDANKKKMEKMKVTQLANAAMKLMRRNSVSEGLWDNIRAKRARGEKMRKKGEKGAPTQDQIKRRQGESVEEGKKNVAMDAELMGLYTKAMKAKLLLHRKRLSNKLIDAENTLGLREGLESKKSLF